MPQLKERLKSVRVLGLAESTHGTKEFIDIRHSMLQYLVTELQFNVFALEASESAAHEINDYVVHGAGDCASALTGLGLVWWDVEEMVALIEWLREYNRSVGADRKVSFRGLDFWNTRRSRRRVLEHLRVVAAEWVAVATEAFEAIARAEAKGMMRAHEAIDLGVYRAVERLENVLAGGSGLERDLTLALQCLRACLTGQLSEGLPPGLPKSVRMNNYARSRFMAENLVHLMTEGGPHTKAIVWAHVFHLGIGFEDPQLGLVCNMGSDLRELFGNDYYVFGLEQGSGEYLARQWLPDDSLGDLVVGAIPPAPDGSLLCHLSRTGLPSMTLDFRDARGRPESVARLIGEPEDLHAAAWARGDPTRLYMRRAVAHAYDGLIFVSRGSPATPTAGALRSVAEASGW